MTLRIVLLVLLVAYGVPLFVVGALGWRQRLAKAGRLGVRTTAALRDEETFLLANRVAGLPGMVAGVVAVLGGVAAMTVPTTIGSVVAAVIGVVGAVLIARAGGVLGTRAAAAVPAPAPAACGGSCLGCASVCAVPQR